MKKKSYLKKDGFTLIELMVVIAIIITLFSFITPKIISYETKAKEIKAINTAKQVQSALETTYLSYENFQDTNTIKNDIMELININITSLENKGEAKNEVVIKYNSDEEEYSAELDLKENNIVVTNKNNKIIYSKKN